MFGHNPSSSGEISIVWTSNLFMAKRKIAVCTKIAKVRELGKYLYEVTSKCEHHATKIETGTVGSTAVNINNWRYLEKHCLVWIFANNFTRTKHSKNLALSGAAPITLYFVIVHLSQLINTDLSFQT